MRSMESTLSSLSDGELVDRIKETADSGALLELYERHAPLIKQGMDSVFRYQSGVAQDINDDKLFLLHQAAQGYDPSRGQFNTWVRNFFNWKSKNALGKHKKEVERSYSIDDEFSHSDEPCYKVCFDFESGPNEIFEAIEDYLNSCTDDRIKPIFLMRYFSEKKYTWSEIGETVGLSNQGAINLHDRHMNFIRRKIGLDKDAFSVENFGDLSIIS